MMYATKRTKFSLYERTRRTLVDPRAALDAVAARFATGAERLAAACQVRR